MKHNRIIRGMIIAVAICLLAGCLSIEAEAASKIKWRNTGTTKTVLVKTSTTLKTNYKNSKVKWSSSNKKIATVNSKGKVKFLKTGTVTIKCRLKKNSKKYVKCKITVRPKASGLQISAAGPVLVAGKTFKSNVKISPSNAYSVKTWSSSNTNVATVDSNGNVKAKAAGTVTISATLKDGSNRKSSYTVNVIDKITQSEEGTKFIAHRGYSSQAPENTVKAFELAGNAGFWGAECDVQVTKDGQFVIFHDSNLSDCGESKKTIKDLTLEQVKSLNIKTGKNYSKYKDIVEAIKIPTLDEYLYVCIEKNMTPVIEIKMAYNVMEEEQEGNLTTQSLDEDSEELSEEETAAIELEEEIQELPEVHELHGQTLQEVSRTTLERLYDQVKDRMGDRPYVFIAFDERSIEKMESLYTMDQQAGDAPNMTVQWLFNKNNYSTAGLNKCIEKKRGLDIAYGTVASKYFKGIQKDGIVVNVWTVDDLLKTAELVFAGADYITTNVKVWE